MVNDISSFVDYLKDNPDGSIQNFEDTETLFKYVEVEHLNKKAFDFTSRGEEWNLLIYGTGLLITSKSYIKSL